MHEQLAQLPLSGRLPNGEFKRSPRQIATDAKHRFTAFTRAYGALLAESTKEKLLGAMAAYEQFSKSASLALLMAERTELATFTIGDLKVSGSTEEEVYGSTSEWCFSSKTGELKVAKPYERTPADWQEIENYLDAAMAEVPGTGKFWQAENPNSDNVAGLPVDYGIPMKVLGRSGENKAVDTVLFTQQRDGSLKLVAIRRPLTEQYAFPGGFSPDNAQQTCIKELLEEVFSGNMATEDSPSTEAVNALSLDAVYASIDKTVTEQVGAELAKPLLSALNAKLAERVTPKVEAKKARIATEKAEEASAKKAALDKLLQDNSKTTDALDVHVAYSLIDPVLTQQSLSAEQKTTFLLAFANKKNNEAVETKTKDEQRQSSNLHSFITNVDVYKTNANTLINDLIETVEEQAECLTLNKEALISAIKTSFLKEIAKSAEENEALNTAITALESGATVDETTIAQACEAAVRAEESSSKLVSDIISIIDTEGGALGLSAAIQASLMAQIKVAIYLQTAAGKAFAQFIADKLQSLGETSNAADPRNTNKAQMTTELFTGLITHDEFDAKLSEWQLAFSAGDDAAASDLVSLPDFCYENRDEQLQAPYSSHGALVMKALMQTVDANQLTVEAVLPTFKEIAERANHWFTNQAKPALEKAHTELPDLFPIKPIHLESRKGSIKVSVPKPPAPEAVPPPRDYSPLRRPAPKTTNKRPDDPDIAGVSLTDTNAQHWEITIDRAVAKSDERKQPNDDVTRSAYYMGAM